MKECSRVPPANDAKNDFERLAQISAARSKLSAVLEELDRLDLPLSAAHLQAALDALNDTLRQN